MTEKNVITPNLRALMLLEVIGLNDHPLTVSEIHQQVQLPKQTVYRLIKTLENAGFLTRDYGGKRLRPSRRSRLMGTGLLHASCFHIARHQILKDVAAKLKETVNFVVPEDSGMRYVDRVETDWPFRVQMPTGSNVPFHCAASGKIFMASLSKAARTRFVSGLRLERHTENTHTCVSALMDDLQICRKRGFSLDREELFDGMVATAVPVTDRRGRFVAALAVHGPRQRISPARALEFVDCLSSAAEQLRDTVF